MSRSWQALYVVLQTGYLSGLGAALGCVLLALYFFGGVDLSRLDWRELLIYGTPLFAARQAIRLWLNRFTVRPEIEGGWRLLGGLVSIAAWPVYLAALVKVLRQEPLQFHVTPKGRVRKVRGTARRMFRPHLAWALLNALGLVAMVVLHRPSPVLAGWAALNAVLLGALWLIAEHTERATIATPSAAPEHEPQVLVPARSTRPAGATSLVHPHVVDHV